MDLTCKKCKGRLNIIDQTDLHSADDYIPHYVILELMANCLDCESNFVLLYKLPIEREGIEEISTEEY